MRAPESCADAVLTQPAQKTTAKQIVEMREKTAGNRTTGIPPDLSTRLRPPSRTRDPVWLCFLSCITIRPELYRRCSILCSGVSTQSAQYIISLSELVDLRHHPGHHRACSKETPLKHGRAALIVPLRISGAIPQSI
jgi:hypothetical protein